MNFVDWLLVCMLDGFLIFLVGLIVYWIYKTPRSNERELNEMTECLEKCEQDKKEGKQ